MSTFIKSLNKNDTKFSVNGKLCVIVYGVGKNAVAFTYSHKLNFIEEKDFKKHLRSIEKIV